MASNSKRNSKNSLTFESIVCSQIELQRRAASFSHRRSTMCRPSSQYRLSSSSSSSSSNHPSTPFNRIMLLTPMSSRASTQYPKTQISSAIPSESSSQLLAMKPFSISKSVRASTVPSPVIDRKESIADRQSVGSILYWDSFPRNASSKRHGSRWSIDLPKETRFYWSLRLRLIEEYTESESLLEFSKKTVLVLMTTKEATIFLCVILILPVIMMGIGVSHLTDCPRQKNLPIYLFVAGIVWTTKLLQNIWHKYRLRQKRLTDEEPSSNHNDGHAFIDRLMTSFLIIWFFFGQYWLVTIGYPPHFEQTLENPDIWCHKTVVYGALASTVITYLLLLIFICIATFLVFLTRYTIIKRVSLE